MELREKVIKGLEHCVQYNHCGDECPTCIYYKECATDGEPLMRDALALLKSLSAFKAYFDGLYGQGLDVANYHLNGATEPFDSFYDSAMEEYENV